MNDPVSQVVRLFTILHLVAARRQGRAITRRQLADVCTCSIKTIQRDIEDLKSASVPIFWDEAEQSYVLPDKGWTLPTLLLTQTDALALALVRRLVAGTPMFPFADQVATTLDKATAGLSPPLTALVEAAFAAWNEVDSTARDYSHVPLQTLVMATVRKRTIEMTYDSAASGISVRRVDPYRFDRRAGRYLDMQAWCHKSKIVRTFALNRVLEARMIDETFVLRPWDSSDEGVISGLRGGARVAIEVCFDKVVARSARERHWPFKVALEDLPDGSVVLRGEVQGLDGIVCELLSWRHHAHVLGGPELRARMIEEVRALASLYLEP